ncbi:MAG: mannose-1-phosphate guanylyltransferase [Deltaproteobacteria bacterium]|nr:mannose-1-phosphate guanylyltransferase [Deltaproteobacteria bacterium]
MKDYPNLYACLLAGGYGTRFWPLSRESHPKQLLKLFSDKTLIEETYDRIHSLIPDRRVVIATSRNLTPKLQELLPSLPKENFISEPVSRNTSACIGLAALEITKRDPDAIMAVLPSDHYISDSNEFLEIIEASVFFAQRRRIVTLGITPTHPETGYGYIKFGEFEQLTGEWERSLLEQAEKSEGRNPLRHRARQIAAFVEKPDYQTAVTYLKAGRYLWNSGIFIFKASLILDKIKQHMPVLHDGLMEIDSLIKAGADDGEITEVYGRLPSISIDYGVMEKAEGIVVIPASFGWSDVGSWRALSAFPTDEEENFKFGDVVTLDTRESVLYAAKGMVATYGLSGIVVVSTGEVVLVCPKEQTQHVKLLVDLLREKGKTEYL